MREKIKIKGNKMLEISHDSGHFGLAIWDDEISVELTLYSDDFEKLRNAINEAWEDWLFESRPPLSFSGGGDKGR